MSLNSSILFPSNIKEIRIGCADRQDIFKILSSSSIAHYNEEEHLFHVPIEHFFTLVGILFPYIKEDSSFSITKVNHRVTLFL